HRQLNGPPTRPLRPVIPDNARTLRITAAAGTELAGASFGGTVTQGLLFEALYSSLPTVVYNPKAVIPHAASLRQPCGIAHYSPLLPPVGVWAVSQSQCG